MVVFSVSIVLIDFNTQYKIMYEGCKLRNYVDKKIIEFKIKASYVEKKEKYAKNLRIFYLV